MPAPKLTAYTLAPKGTTGALAITIPAATSVGDLIAIRGATNASGAITHNGVGYNVGQDATATGETSSLVIWKVATSSDPGSTVTFTFPSNQRCTDVCLIYAAGTFDPANPFPDEDKIATGGGTANYTNPALTAPMAGCSYIIWDVMQGPVAYSGVTFTPPSGFTPIMMVNTTLGSRNNYQGVAYMDLGAPGTYGPYTATWNTTDNTGGGANSLLLAPAQSTSQSFNRSASDAAALAESTAVKKQSVRAGSDTATKTEAIAARRAFVRTGSTVSTVTETVARGVGSTRASSDTILGRSDSALSQKGVGRIATDTMTPVDAVASRMLKSRAASDAMAVTDVVSRVAAIARIVNDVATSVDSAAKSTAITRFTSDGAAHSDSVATQSGTSRFTSDSFVATDSNGRLLRLYRSGVDVLGSVDSSTRTITVNRIASDATLLEELVTRALEFLRNATELSSLAEDVTWEFSTFVPPPDLVYPVRLILTPNLASLTIDRVTSKLNIDANTPKLEIEQNKATLKLEDPKMSNWKTGDTWPPIVLTVLNGDGTPVDLTAATAIKLHSKPPTDAPVINVAMTPVDLPNGRVQYEWGSTDLAVAGQYNDEVEVTWGNGKIQTFPADGTIKHTVTEQIA